MSNRDLEAAWRYHNTTKHSWQSVHSAAHHLDWSNQPVPFKLYRDLEGESLPTDLPASGVPALEAIAAQPAERQCVPTCRDLAGLFYYAAGITKRGVTPGGQLYFRAAACTGALYHIELYLVCGDLPDLPAGVYHFGPHDFALRRLREGDFRGVLVEASGREPAVTEAPAVLVSSSVYWRNSWKYQARAYRHAYWDSGTILANLLAVAAGRRVPVKVVTSFVDGPVNRLLDLDDRREVALQLIPVGRVPGQTVPHPPEVAPLGLEVTPYSGREVDYPAIWEMHAATSLLSPEEARGLWGNPPPLPGPQTEDRLIPLAPLQESQLPADAIEEVIPRRGSSRRFRRAAITYPQLSTMLERATRGVAADFLDESPNPPFTDESPHSPFTDESPNPPFTNEPPNPPFTKGGLGGISLNQLYLIVHDVDGLAPGSYVFHRDEGALEQLKAGDFREQAGYLGLQQALPADASVDVFILTDLAAVLERYGNRGYRMAQLEASIMGGRLYLAAYAQRLGATGLTFFDDDVTGFFSPHAQGKSVMFLVALGRPQRRRRA